MNQSCDGINKKKYTKPAKANKLISINNYRDFLLHLNKLST